MSDPIKLNLPEFKQMSRAVKDDLTQRFRPAFCPNCGANNTDGVNIFIHELISSVPCWNVNCRMCGAGYQLHMYE